MQGQRPAGVSEGRSPSEAEGCFYVVSIALNGLSCKIISNDHISYFENENPETLGLGARRPLVVCRGNALLGEVPPDAKDF